MTTDRLVIKTFKEIAQVMRNRRFPRRLIQDRNREIGLLQAVLDAMIHVNTISYKPRFYELPCAGNHLDLTQIKIPGIRVKRVLDLIPISEQSSVFSLYERMMYGQPIFFNLIRNQDNFIDYVFSREVYRQIQEKYQNKSHNWEHAGDKVILGQHWIGSTKATIVFIPYFDEAPNGELAISAEPRGFTDGIRKTYTGFLKEPFIKPGSVVIHIGSDVFTDDGETLLVGPQGTQATINYGTGEFVITYGVAPLTLQAIIADYINLDYSWEFSQKEWSFFSEVLEAIVGFREGRAQGEMKFAEVEGNTGDLMAEEQKINEIVEKFTKKAYIRQGRKF